MPIPSPYAKKLAAVAKHEFYWFNFPNAKMVRQFKRKNGTRYAVNNAAQYAELCLDRWDRLMGATPKDLVVTGAAYWGEGNTQRQAEDKLEEFLDDWDRFDRVIGLNWWHFGGQNSMSHRMLESIVRNELGAKHYKHRTPDV